jgi:lipoyl-dependent peroxiredoxin
MKIQRSASAHWQGTGKEGKGLLSSQSKTLNNTNDSAGSRFEQATGTNPEELIGAAHAGCFSMKLAFILQAAGITPDSIDTTANVTFEDGKITTSELNTKVKAAGLTNEILQEHATNAKENCPVSKALNVAISMKAELA